MKRVASLLFVLGLIAFPTGCLNELDDTEFPPFSWSESSPAQQGMSTLKLDSASARASELGFVDGLVIIRNGYLVREEYYNGYDVNAPHQIWSDTKSFMSAIIGIAVRDGIIESLDKHVMDYFPEYAYPGMDTRYNDITIRHLLTMRMGIDTEERIMIPVLQTDDWIRETLRLPLIFGPGQRFSYNSLETHLLSAIITKSSGMDLLTYARIHLTGPMGIQIASWGQDPKGYRIGGYDISMTPRDMAVLGYLYLNGGKLNGIQIVPGEWVEESLAKSWSSDALQWGVLREYNYGYLWWLGKMNGYRLFMALGMGGQYIITFPELNLIVVATANKDISWDNVQELPILEIVSRYILPAVNE